MEESKPNNSPEEEKPPNNPQDAVHQQQLKNPSTDEPIVPAAETTSEADQLSTLNLKPLNPDMEVHHHAHHDHGKKNWKSYFWEFLMLFLAVFCGFLAEYQLEHVIENNREKQYIHSILEDLREDTTELSSTIKSYLESQEKNDTLIRLLSSEDVKNQGSALYYLGRVASKRVRLVIRDATIQQLKNSGGLRLIRKGRVSKAIIEYYNNLVFIDYLQKIEDEEIMEYRKMAVDIFHPVLFNDIINTSNNQVIRPQGNPSLLTYDPKILLRIAGMVSYVRNTGIGLAKREAEMRTAATELIDLIKNEYHLP